MRRIVWTLLVAVGCAPLVAGAPGAPAWAQTPSVKALFEKYDLIGTFAVDCAKPAGAENLYDVHRVTHGIHVQADQMSGPTTRSSAFLILKAAESKPNELTLEGTMETGLYTVVLRLEGQRKRTMEMTRERSDKVITGGRRTNNGGEMPWYTKCVQKVTIRSSPDVGGKCIDVPYGEFRAGIRLQMWDCNDKPSQIFSFDGSSGRLTIGSLCVDANVGSGQSGDQLQLATCNDGSGQVWKAEANGNYLKIMGTKGLCVDIQGASKENSAAVKLWQCHGGANQNWLMYQALNLTFEENTNYAGNTIREFIPAAADAKICQNSCIEDRQCEVWVYRKPAGRTDRKPHCWLRNKIVDVQRGSTENLTISGSVRYDAAKSSKMQK